MMPLPILAEVNLSDQPVLLFIAMSGVVALISVCRNVIGAIKDYREMRMNPEGVDYVTKKELGVVHGRLDEVLGSFAEFSTSINRSVGRLEGMEKTMDHLLRRLESLDRKL